MVTTRRRRKFPPPASATALKAARPEEAARLLGRCWAVEARVEHGDARGRTMGFPTANMHLGHCLAPAFGVYAVRVTILENEKPIGRHDGVANFGIRPMYQTDVPLMEAHLFDFDGDLYGKHLSVELIAYIRPEAKFDESGRPDRPDRRRCRKRRAKSWPITP